MVQIPFLDMDSFLVRKGLGYTFCIAKLLEAVVKSVVLFEDKSLYQ